MLRDAVSRLALQGYEVIRGTVAEKEGNWMLESGLQNRGRETRTLARVWLGCDLGGWQPRWIS